MWRRAVARAAVREPSNTAHAVAVAPDGSVVFEAKWHGGTEHIWRLRPGGGVPELISSSFPNDVSPHVLPDGRIVSLWLGARGGGGRHHVKVMDTDGSNGIVLTLNAPFEDIGDIGLGCGPAAP